MTDLFSVQFLTKLKEQARSKTKTSKALIDAMKQLTKTNSVQKKRIQQLEQQIKVIRNENSMLVQMLQTSKEKSIDIQAKLVAENQSLKQQIQKLTDEIEILKNCPLTNNSFSSHNNELQKQFSAKAEDLEEKNLDEYLFSDQKINGVANQQECEDEVSIDKKFFEISKSLVNRKTMHTSQNFQNYKSSEDVQTILQCNR